MSFTLASQSSIRAHIFRNAGVCFKEESGHHDEAAIKATILAQGATPDEISDTLAEYKAKRIAQNNGGFVLGCDLILVCEGKIFSKPATLDNARVQLCNLRGKTHHLFSAGVIYEDHRLVWRVIERADLKMRDFSDTFLDTYLVENGDSILKSVGCYQIEKKGISLFDRLSGDYHAILGLPLLAILSYLRQRGFLQQ